MLKRMKLGIVRGADAPDRPTPELGEGQERCLGRDVESPEAHDGSSSHAVDRGSPTIVSTKRGLDGSSGVTERAAYPSAEGVDQFHVQEQPGHEPRDANVVQDRDRLKWRASGQR